MQTTNTWWYTRHEQNTNSILTTPPRYNEENTLLPAFFKPIRTWRLSGFRMPRGWEGRAAQHGGADFALPMPMLLQSSRWNTWQKLGDNIRQLISHCWLPAWLLQSTNSAHQPATWQHRNYLHPQRAAPTYGDRELPHGASQQQRDSRLAREALWSPCMLLDHLNLGYDMPAGCVCHAYTGAVTTTRAPSTAPSTAGGGAAKQRYLRVQVAAGVHEYAHRLLAWLRLGPPPRDEASGRVMEATHLCNNRACVNPYHIIWVGVGAAGGGARSRAPWGRRGGWRARLAH